MPNGHAVLTSVVEPVDVKTTALVVDIGFKFVGTHLFSCGYLLFLGAALAFLAGAATAFSTGAGFTTLGAGAGASSTTGAASTSLAARLRLCTSLFHDLPIVYSPICVKVLSK